MHIKYFQPIADILDHYDDIMHHIDNPKFGHSLLETWGVDPADKELLEQEREALRYLIDCRLDFARERDSHKPSIEVMNRCLNRHLAFLERIHKCHAYNVNKHSSSLIRKEYKACRHYLFKFSLPAWYEKMPDVVLSFENKYPHFA